MPLKGKVRYRVKTTKTGKKIRLAFRNGKVIEAKNLKTGDIHTEAEFKRDEKKKKKKSFKERAKHRFRKGLGR